MDFDSGKATISNTVWGNSWNWSPCLLKLRNASVCSLKQLSASFHVEEPSNIDLSIWQVNAYNCLPQKAAVTQIPFQGFPYCLFRNVKSYCTFSWLRGNVKGTGASALEYSDQSIQTDGSTFKQVNIILLILPSWDSIGKKNLVSSNKY